MLAIVIMVENVVVFSFIKEFIYQTVFETDTSYS